jgi:VanZ family protein
MKMDNMPQAPMTHFDKLVHTLLFFGLSGVVFFDNTRYLRQSTPLQRIFFGSFLFPVFFGGMIEVLQGYAHRSGDWMDFLFDAIGVVAGILICWLINTRLKSPTDG